jgi:squalene-associated FAD-dependent desaturase
VMATLAEDHAACARVLSESGSSFALPIRLLPAAKRKAMTALYAFCRRADDIADGCGGEKSRPGGDVLARRRAELMAFREALAAALAGADCLDPVLRAMADAATAYAIPSRFLFAVLDGVEQDLELERQESSGGCLFESLDQLHAYCRRVASAVGMASVHIWGFSGSEALPAADACGIAFQMTNILRDVTEDLNRGRVYLPHDDLRACGVSLEDLRAATAADGDVQSRLEQLLSLQLARTAALYTEAASLDHFLSRDGRRIFRAMFGIYRSIFEAVVRAGGGIFRGRPKPSRFQLAGSLVSAAVRGPRPPRAGFSSPILVVEPKADPKGEPLPIVIVGGGLAGLAAAASLVEAGVVAHGTPVRILESRRHSGGRAASFESRESGDLVDACQHLAMGCCTNFIDFCRRAGIDSQLRRDRELWFIGPDGRRAGCMPTRWLPAPLHLAPLLLALPQFSLREKAALAWGMIQLVRWQPGHKGPDEALAWLQQRGQPRRVIDLFWAPVLESALGDSVQRVSVAASRKVMLDGFLAHRLAADLHLPKRPLGELFGVRVAGWLRARGVQLETGSAVTALEYAADGRVAAVRTSRRCREEKPDRELTGGDDGERIACRACVVAVPWRAAARLAPAVMPEGSEKISGSPITAVHLWFDRPVIDLPHAVLLGTLSQWVFCDGEFQAGTGSGYCQVVISGSHQLRGADRANVRDRVVAELGERFPGVRGATLLDSRIVTDPAAVISVQPGVDSVRPAAATSVPNLFLAGDWTATGWPSTMEGAVRSGRLAAAACLSSCGAPQPTLTPDLKRALLVRLITGRSWG